MKTAIDVNKFIGIPFVPGGRGEQGTDCVGIVKLVYEEYGIPFELKDTTEYEKWNDVEKQIFEYMKINFIKRESIRDLKPFDIILVKYGKQPIYPMIYAGTRRYLSTSVQTGVILGRITSWFLEHTQGIYQFKYIPESVEVPEEKRVYTHYEN